MGTAAIPASKQHGIAIPRISATAALMRVAHGLWPIKTDLWLAEHAGVCDRAARAWLAGRSTPSLEALVRLLACPSGFQFLRALMERRETVPAWWSRMVRAAEVEALLRKQDEQWRLVERLTQEAAE